MASPLKKHLQTKYLISALFLELYIVLWSHNYCIDLLIVGWSLCVHMLCIHFSKLETVHFMINVSGSDTRIPIVLMLPIILANWRNINYSHETRAILKQVFLSCLPDFL